MSIFVQYIFIIVLEKIKAGIFKGPQMRKLTKNLQFASHLTKQESTAWTAFVQVIKNLVRNFKVSNYVELVGNLQQLQRSWMQHGRQSPFSS